VFTVFNNDQQSLKCVHQSHFFNNNASSLQSIRAVVIKYVEMLTAQQTMKMMRKMTRKMMRRVIRKIKKAARKMKKVMMIRMLKLKITR